MNANVQFIQYTPQQLQDAIQCGIKNQLDEFLQNFTKTHKKEYLTRQDVADLFKVDLSTIHNWCKTGKLKPYGIGSRVYFLQSDIDTCLTPLNK